MSLFLKKEALCVCKNKLVIECLIVVALKYALKHVPMLVIAKIVFIDMLIKRLFLHSS